MSGKIDISIEELSNVYEQLHKQLEERIDLDQTVVGEVRINTQNYLSKVLEMALKSVQITNTSTTNIEEIKKLILEKQNEYIEPFDIQLNEKVRDKYEQWEIDAIKVSNLRNQGPESMNTLYNTKKNEILAKLDNRINAVDKLYRDSQSRSVDELDDLDDCGGDVDTHYSLQSQSQEQQYWDALETEYLTSLNNINYCAHLKLKTNLDKLKNLITYLENK